MYVYIYKYSPSAFQLLLLLLTCNVYFNINKEQVILVFVND